MSDAVLVATGHRVVHHWDRVLQLGGRRHTSLSLYADEAGQGRGAIHTPGESHEHLILSDWDLDRPERVHPEWVDEVKTALGQLQLRATGRQHHNPHPDGYWEASVERRHLITQGALPVDSILGADHPFIPTHAQAYASTSGSGKVHLFGRGTFEAASMTFAACPDGTADFHTLNPMNAVPDWVREPAREVASMARLALKDSDGRLVGA